MSAVKSVLLIGATGSIGSIILDAPTQEYNFTVSLLRRASSAAKLPSHLPVIRIADTYPSDALVHAFAGQNEIVHILGLPKKTPEGVVKDALRRWPTSPFRVLGNPTDQSRGRPARDGQGHPDPDGGVRPARHLPPPALRALDIDLEDEDGKPESNTSMPYEKESVGPMLRVETELASPQSTQLYREVPLDHVGFAEEGSEAGTYHVGDLLLHAIAAESARPPPLPFEFLDLDEVYRDTAHVESPEDRTMVGLHPNPSALRGGFR
ncbi:hypothetical protein LQW54_006865 [Pestalotiopsis sp. IQ-011]